MAAFVKIEEVEAYVDPQLLFQQLIYTAQESVHSDLDGFFFAWTVHISTFVIRECSCAAEVKKKFRLVAYNTEYIWYCADAFNRKSDLVSTGEIIADWETFFMHLYCAKDHAGGLNRLLHFEIRLPANRCTSNQSFITY